MTEDRKAHRDRLLQATTDAYHLLFATIAGAVGILNDKQIDAINDALAKYRDAVAEYSILRTAADLVENAPKEERA